KLVDHCFSGGNPILNGLPESIAQRWKRDQDTVADRHERTPGEANRANDGLPGTLHDGGGQLLGSLDSTANELPRFVEYPLNRLLGFVKQRLRRRTDSTEQAAAALSLCFLAFRRGLLFTLAASLIRLTLPLLVMVHSLLLSSPLLLRNRL